MSRLTGLFASIALVGCSGVTLKADKLDATKRLAIVGVCQGKQVWVDLPMTSMFQGEWGPMLAEPSAKGFDAIFPTALKGTEVIPLAKVLATAGLPEGGPVPDTYSCVGGLHPLTPKTTLGITTDIGLPNLAVMKKLADKLNVDAVLALHLRGTMKSSFKGAALTSDMGMTSYAYIVDRSGELIAEVPLSDIETERIEHLENNEAFYKELGGMVDVKEVSASLTAEQARVIGAMFGGVVAEQLAAVLLDR